MAYRVPVPFGVIDPGEKDRLITIEQLTETTGPTGFPVEVWTTLVQVWAARYNDRGSERFKANQTSAIDVTRWETGYRPDLDPELLDVPKQRRIVYQGRVFDILESSLIDQKGANLSVEFYARAKVG